MSSSLAVLSQQTPKLPTRKGLILTGLQNDFLSSDGKLPVDNLESGFLDRTKALINEFRGHDDVVWMRTVTEASRNPGELDGDACNVITSLTQHYQLEAGESSDEMPRNLTHLSRRGNGSLAMESPYALEHRPLRSVSRQRHHTASFRRRRMPRQKSWNTSSCGQPTESPASSKAPMA